MTKPIILDAYSVQTILSGHKVQFRQIIKPQPDHVTKDGTPIVFKAIEVVDPETKQLKVWSHVPGKPRNKYCDVIECSYKVGDILWVRETFAVNPDDSGYIYKADDLDWESFTYIIWRSPVAMPRAASRINIKVENTWTELLGNPNQWEWVVELKEVDF